MHRFRKNRVACELFMWEQCFGHLGLGDVASSSPVQVGALNTRTFIAGRSLGMFHGTLGHGAMSGTRLGDIVIVLPLQVGSPTWVSQREEAALHGH